MTSYFQDVGHDVPAAHCCISSVRRLPASPPSGCDVIAVAICYSHPYMHTLLDFFEFVIMLAFINLYNLLSLANFSLYVSVTFYVFFIKNAF